MSLFAQGNSVLDPSVIRSYSPFILSGGTGCDGGRKGEYGERMVGHEAVAVG